MNFSCWVSGTWAAGSWVVGSWCPGPEIELTGGGPPQFMRLPRLPIEDFDEDDELIAWYVLEEM